MEIVFLAESVSAESWGTGQIRVVVEAKASDVMEDLDVEDRVKGLDEHEVIEAMGVTKTLNTLNEKELADWIKDGCCDTTDLLNAIGYEAISEWLNSSDD